MHDPRIPFDPRGRIAYAPPGGGRDPRGRDYGDEPRLRSHDDAARRQRREERRAAAAAPDEPADQTIRHERRDERHFVRVPAPFSVDIRNGERLLAGSDLSLGGFSATGDRGFDAGTVIPVSLLIATGAAEMIVPADARVIRSSRAGESVTTAFEITRIEDRHRELLRRVIRAHLSGRYASVEDMLDDEDPQTPRKRRSAAAAAAAATAGSGEGRGRRWGRYAALGAAAVVLLAVTGATAYRNFMLIEPDFAAVTAPRVDIRAPGSGMLAEHDLEAGDRVSRDQALVRVVNSDLRTDLMLARAAYRYNERLIDNIRERLDDGSVEQVSMAETAAPPENGPVEYSLVSPEIAKARIDEFETARDFEVSKIAALEARMAANDIYSPCNCLVAWARSAAGGSYIEKGERIVTLIKTGENDLLVEALVHMSQIDRIDPHQRAFIALPNASEPIAARVHAVSLDVERQPRAGFPKWVRQQQNVASVLLVPEEPLPASAVGVPVDVRFSEAPYADAAAEWVWQGGRAVAQKVGRAVNAAWTEITGDEPASRPVVPVDRTDPPAEGQAASGGVPAQPQADGQPQTQTARTPTTGADRPGAEAPSAAPAEGGPTLPTRKPAAGEAG